MLSIASVETVVLPPIILMYDDLFAIKTWDVYDAVMSALPERLRVSNIGVSFGHYCDLHGSIPDRHFVDVNDPNPEQVLNKNGITELREHEMLHRMKTLMHSVLTHRIDTLFVYLAEEGLPFREMLSNTMAPHIVLVDMDLFDNKISKEDAKAIHSNPNIQSLTVYHNDSFLLDGPRKR